MRIVMKRKKERKKSELLPGMKRKKKMMSLKINPSS